MKKILVTVLGLVFAFLAFAAFDDVTLNSGTDLRVTVGGSLLDFTVENGRVKVLNVEGGRLTATLSAGSSIDITSADRRAFTYTTGSATANFTCGSSSSVLSINLASGASADQDITITPIGTCTVSSGGSERGGGVSYPETPTGTPAPAPTAPSSAPTVAASVITIVPPAAPVAPSVAKPSPVAQIVSPVFNKDLQLGSKGDDIKRLQKLLGVEETGYFGKLTRKAVIEFQKKYGLPAIGRMGPKTRAKLQEVFSNIKSGSDEGGPAQSAGAAAGAQSQNQKLQEQIQMLLKQLQDLQQKANQKKSGY